MLLQSTEEVFYNESMEVLAEAAGQIVASTPSGAIRSIMPGLSTLGPEGQALNPTSCKSSSPKLSTPWGSKGHPHPPPHGTEPPLNP